MQLKQYLKKKRLTQAEFIQICHEKTGKMIPQGTFAKWVVKTRIPRKKEMETIFSITKGQVQPNDFYNLER